MLNCHRDKNPLNKSDTVTNTITKPDDEKKNYKNVTHTK